MKKLLFACLVPCTAYAEGCLVAVEAPVAHICTQEELASHKVNVCHVPAGNPENAHTICVDDDSTNRPYNGHFPGQHGGDYLGKCSVYTPTTTPTTSPTQSSEPTLPPEESTPTPTNVPSLPPTEVPTEAPTSVPTNVPTLVPTSLPTSQSTPTSTETPVVAVECPLQETEVNKDELLRFATRLKNKAVKYYVKSSKCGNRLASKQIRTLLKVFTIFQSKIESFPDRVEVCGGGCVQIVTEGLIQELKYYAKLISKHAVTSQSYGELCRNKKGGVLKTQPLIKKFSDIVNQCPTQVCL